MRCNSYDLAEESNIHLSGTDNSDFLVLVIMLFFARNVNRTEDFAAADIKNSAPCNEVRSEYLLCNLKIDNVFWIFGINNKDIIDFTYETGILPHVKINLFSI